jgi:hypothetical protein
MASAAQNFCALHNDLAKENHEIGQNYDGNYVTPARELVTNR